jgi:MFS family permease
MEVQRVAATTTETTASVDWRELWASGLLGRFCFISLGILLHATNETMIATVMPGMVADIGGVELVGWSLAIFEVGSIAAGAAAGRLVSYMPLRTNMAGAAAIYAVGALICATAPSMEWHIAGRLFQGVGGGGLVALAFVSVERLFPGTIWPQLFAIMSVIWGVAAFSGPLLGAVMVEALSWRWAFGVFVFAGMGMAAVTFVVLNSPEARRRASGAGAAMLPRFPILRLLVLAAAIVLIALAGIGIEPLRSSALLVAGLGGIGLFFLLDARRPDARLFPRRPLDPTTRVGSGLIMFGAFSAGAVSFTIYAPLILTTLHGVSVITTGYLIAAEAVAWSVASILVAGARPEMERAISLGGAIMITMGIAGFSYAMPSGSVWLVLACAILQGSGFGLVWPFVTRIVVSAAHPDERSVASSAVPTIQRIGYAVGAAVAGIIANASGFSRGLSGETAANVASWLFMAFIPLGLVGCLAAIRLLRQAQTDG